MPENQKQIYYQAGTDFASIAKSPNLEIFRRRGIEVLYLTDPVDEFALESLGAYHEKKLTSIDSADIEIPEASATGEKEGESTSVGGEGERLPQSARAFPRSARDPGERGARVEAVDRQPVSAW